MGSNISKKLDQAVTQKEISGSLGNLLVNINKLKDTLKKKDKQKAAAGLNKGGRVKGSHGGGVGIQTHGNKLAKALNTKTPDHSVYLNEDGYLKGGIKVRS